MSSEKLVLWRTRRQRLAETFIYPIAWVPIGPAMRLLMGNAYLPIYGIGMTFVVLLLVPKLTSWWVQRPGGEWITVSERTQRLVDEARTTSVWPEALANPAMLVLLMLGLLLITDPLDELGSSVGLGAGIFYILAAGALLGAASTVLGRRRLRQSLVIKEKPPENFFWLLMRRLTPRMFLANLVGFMAGI